MDLRFKYSNVSSLTIPNSVVAIGVRAFQSNKLTSLVIENINIEIDYEAFNSTILTQKQINEFPEKYQDLEQLEFIGITLK